jgi:hypothetical protein
MDDIYKVPTKGSCNVIERSQFWMQVISDQKASGKKMKQFCREHQLSYHSFKSWKYRSSNKTKDSLEIIGNTNCQDKATGFIQLQVAPNDMPINELNLSKDLKIVFKNGHCITVPAGDFDTIFFIIKSIARLPC